LTAIKTDTVLLAIFIPLFTLKMRNIRLLIKILHQKNRGKIRDFFDANTVFFINILLI